MTCNTTDIIENNQYKYANYKKIIITKKKQ